MGFPLKENEFLCLLIIRANRRACDARLFIDECLYLHTSTTSILLRIQPHSSSTFIPSRAAAGHRGRRNQGPICWEYRVILSFSPGKGLKCFNFVNANQLSEICLFAKHCFPYSFNSVFLSALFRHINYLWHEQWMRLSPVIWWTVFGLDRHFAVEKKKKGEEERESRNWSNPSFQAPSLVHTRSVCVWGGGGGGEVERELLSFPLD